MGFSFSIPSENGKAIYLIAVIWEEVSVRSTFRTVKYCNCTKCIYIHVYILLCPNISIHERNKELYHVCIYFYWKCSYNKIPVIFKINTIKSYLKERRLYFDGEVILFNMFNRSPDISIVRLLNSMTMTK